MKSPTPAPKPRTIVHCLFVTLPLFAAMVSTATAASFQPISETSTTLSLRNNETELTPVQTENLQPALLANIDAHGLPEQSTPLRAHTLRRSFASLNMSPLQDNVVSASEEGLVLDLFPDTVVKAEKSYTEQRGDEDYTWFGHAQGNTDDAVILSVVNGKLAGMVMRDGDLFHIRPTASGNYEITEVDQATFRAEGSDEAIDLPLAKKTRKLKAVKDGTRTSARPAATRDSGSLDASQIDQQEIEAVELGPRQYSKKRYTAVEDKYKIFFKPFTAEDYSDDLSIYIATIDVAFLVTTTVEANHSGYLAEIQLAVDQANRAFVDSDIYVQLNRVAATLTPYQATTSCSQPHLCPQTDLKRLRSKSDNHMDTIHAMRDQWKADIVTLLVNDYPGACGRAFTLFYGEPKSDWSVNGFNVVAFDCMTEGKTFAHEISHNFGATHDWFVEPSYNCPAGQVPFGSNNACITPQVDAWGPSSYGHGFVTLGGATSIAGRSIMAYPDECMALLNGDCTQRLRFSNPAQGWGVPKGQYHASDNRSVINENRGLVEQYR